MSIVCSLLGMVRPVEERTGPESLSVVIGPANIRKPLPAIDHGRPERPREFHQPHASAPSSSRTVAFPPRCQFRNAVLITQTPSSVKSPLLMLTSPIDGTPHGDGMDTLSV